MLRKLAILLGFSALVLVSSRCFAQGGSYVVGVLPVDDESTEEITDFLPPGITMLLYTHLGEMPNVQPVLLSPGGLYDPESKDWIQQFGRKSHVDALLITRLLPSIKVNDKTRRLNFAFELMDVSTGKVSEKLTDTDVQVKTSDLFISAATGAISSRNPSFMLLKYFLDPIEFEKERLGQAALKLVDWTKASMQPLLPAIVSAASGTGIAPETPACNMTVRIRYTSKRGIAKGYVLLANKTDQSTAVNDGIASFSIAGGPLVIRTSIPDPPYGLPTQKLYMLSTVHDCARPEQELNVDIGAAGEAYLRWDRAE